MLKAKFEVQIYFSFNYFYVLSACMWVYVFQHRCLPGPETLDPWGSGIIGSFKLPDLGACDSNPIPLQCGEENS